MSFNTALYEGDSVIHSEFRADAAAKPRIAGTQRVAQPATVLEIADLATAVLKGGTVLINVAWNAVRSVGLWLEQKAMEAHYRQVESYLAQSSNNADLERRMRQLEHGDRLNWIDCGSR